jgi:hypothetical protein
MEELAERLNDLESTIYRGNGHPGLVTRMSLVEKRQDDIETLQAKWESIATKLALTVAASVLGILGKLVWEMMAAHVH